MTSISASTAASAYFQPISTTTGGAAPQGGSAPAGGAHAGGGKAASSASASDSASSSNSSSSSTESASTENADGTYGPNHTAAPPANTPAAEKVAEAKQLSGQESITPTNTAASSASIGVNILA
jgi:hypothetical protein